MSAFDTNAPKPEEDDQITEDFLGHLVGEGKKFTDNEALARGKHESDRHVTNLERQLAELREDLAQGAQITELMELVRNQSQTATEVPPVDDSSDTSSGQMSPEELKALIEDHVSERDKRSTEAMNLAEVEGALHDKYGESAVRIMHDRAIRMDMTVDELKTLASRNPKAFYRLIGMDQDNTPEPGNMIGGGQRSESGQKRNANVRNFAWYQQKRRENKGAYYAPTFQAQLAKDAEEQGDAFYS